MSDRDIELTRRRVLGGLITVGVGSAAAGAGTVAYFSDTEGSTSNSVSAGTLDLTFGGTATFNFSASLAPTQTTSDSVTLVNSGSVGGSLDVDVDYTENDASPNDTDQTAQNVAQNLEVTSLTYGGNDVTGQISGGSPPTLDDLANNLHGGSESTQNDLINLPDPGSGGTDFSITLRLANVGNDYQSDGVDVTFTFNLNQTDGQ